MVIQNVYFHYAEVADLTAVANDPNMAFDFIKIDIFSAQITLHSELKEHLT